MNAPFIAISNLRHVESDRLDRAPYEIRLDPLRTPSAPLRGPVQPTRTVVLQPQFIFETVELSPLDGDGPLSTSYRYLAHKVVDLSGLDYHRGI